MEEHKPRECPCESVTFDDKKSFCEAWNRWTNCREMGHCTYDEARGAKER